MISLNRICDISYIHLLISPYVFVISRFRICSITLFCDITKSCSFSNLATLNARADLFLEYVILSHAFHTAKFELDNGRHFHWPITVNLVCFNGNYLVPSVDKKIAISLGLKRPSLCNKAPFPRTDVISLYHMLSFHEMKPFIWMLKN